MTRVRTYVADKGRPTLSDLLLDIEVPIKGHGKLGIVLDESIPVPRRDEADVVINAAPQGGRFIRANDLERSGCGCIEPEFIGERQHVKNAKAGAHSGLAGLKRVPREPDARLEVFQRWIVGDKTVDGYGGACGGGGSAVGEGCNFLGLGFWSKRERSHLSHQSPIFS